MARSKISKAKTALRHHLARHPGNQPSGLDGGTAYEQSLGTYACDQCDYYYYYYYCRYRRHHTTRIHVVVVIVIITRNASLPLLATHGTHGVVKPCIYSIRSICINIVVVITWHGTKWLYLY